MNTKEPMFVEERQNGIIKLLNKNDKLTVPELCEAFMVSPATIRNDLNDLAKLGLIKRTHGGAMRSSHTGFELNSAQKSIEHLEQKMAIAAKAFEHVDDNDTIAIDTGTTTLEFVKLLASKKGLTVVVNDIEIARVMEDTTDATVILLGGILRRGFHCTIGSNVIEALNGLRVDKAFMACNGVSCQKGITTPDLYQAEVKKNMIKIAEKVILLCDSSKIGNTSFAQFAPAIQADTIITDTSENEGEISELRLLGINVETV